MNELLSANIDAHKSKVVRNDVRIRASIELLHRDGLGSLLDVGCGNGGFLGNFPEVPRRIGMDIVQRALPEDMEFVQHDISKTFPFPDESVEAVFLGEVIEHVLDTERLLRELHRILLPGGVLVLTTPNLCAMTNAFLWLAGRQLQYVDFRQGQLGHIRYFSPESIRVITNACGFRLETLITNGHNLRDHSPYLGWLEDLSCTIYRYLLRGNCLIAKLGKI